MLETSSAHQAEQTPTLFTGVAAALLAALAVATLYFGREVFVPIALAVLLSFVLAPLVSLLQGWRIPRAFSVIVVVVLAFIFIFSIGGIIARQVAELAGDLPRYQATMSEKIKSLRGTAATTETLERAADVLQDLGKELNKPRDTAARPATPPKTQSSSTASDAQPIPVEVRTPPQTPLQSLGTLIAPLLHPLATTGIIIIFVIFILLQREDLRNRLIKLAGSHDLQKTTAALNDAAHRLSRLFVIQLALNTAFGIVVWLGLWAIGVPSPVLWGILAAVLQFVPYIGAFISAVFPLALAAAVDPGWTMLVWTAALFLTLEPIVGHVIEPLLYGHSTGLSPVAVVVSATFWTALWGPIGLVLATPLTICLVVLGRHVERLSFLDVMFGDRPALSPPEIFYQRMLAGDPAEAVDKAEQFLKERSLSAYYDEVALRGLKLAQADAARGSLGAARALGIKDTAAELIDALAEQDDHTPTRGTTQDVEAAAAIDAAEAVSKDLHVLAKAELTPAWNGEAPILCIASRSALDEAAARMLAQLLEKHGIGAKVEPVETHSTANLFRLDGTGAIAIFLSCLDTNSTAHIRYTIRRLRRKVPQATIVLCCWMMEDQPSSLADSTKADAVVTTLREAVEWSIESARLQGSAPGELVLPQPIPIPLRTSSVSRQTSATSVTA